ncbi:polysaccharide export protein [Altererythrobacter xixiisoli]|uniref:Polysaccharide export protein n=1 Tax=Croceibacterium xixiisoli TaxID=1476466 RepID=A0A6I4TTD8_9SPHN|nr:polysaccharide biosynthesis/export family protein [Croceibacterium xixiisoli]MXO99132.1 polysaccharide export protein [Croceibacterium xixiisoli]
MKVFRLVVTVCALFTTAACASFDTSSVVSTGERYEAFTGVETYHLGAGDELGIIVYNEEALSGTFIVGADGYVSLPLIGNIQATGKTTSEIAAEAQSKYGAGYLRLPSVNAQVTRYRRYYVLGEVSKAGAFDYRPGMNALSAIATAEGFSPRAEQRVLFIRREGGTEEQIFEVTPSLRIFPGDTIRVGERYF